MTMLVASAHFLLMAISWPIVSLFCPNEISIKPVPANWNISVSIQTALVCTDQGLKIYNVSQLPEIQEISQLDPPGFVPFDAAFFGNYAVLVGVQDVAVDPPGPRPGMLVVVDIANPLHPFEVSRIDLGLDALDIKIWNGRAYIAAGSLFIVDLLSIYSPVAIAEYPCGNAQHVCVDGTLAYVACGDGGLNILDVSVPYMPRLIGHADVPSGAHAIAIRKGKAYVTSHGAGLFIFDVLFPSRPRMIGANSQVGDLCDIVIIRNSLFAPGCDENQGWMFMFDIGNPMSPMIKDWVPTSGYPGRIALSRTNLFIAGWDSIIAYELIPCPGNQLPGSRNLNQ